MKNNIKSLKFLLAIIRSMFLIALFVIPGLFLFPSNSRDNLDPSKQKEMMTLVLEWGQLAPFPANASNVIVEAEGSAFTRSFHASFVAPKQDIQDWIRNSKGFSEVVPHELTKDKVWYSIMPGSSANFAEVTIDYILNTVDIYVSWG